MLECGKVDYIALVALSEVFGPSFSTSFSASCTCGFARRCILPNDSAIFKLLNIQDTETKDGNEETSAVGWPFISLYTISFEGVIFCVCRHSYTPPWCVLVPPHEVLYFQQIGPRLRTAIETQCRDERTWTIEDAFSRHLSSSQMSHLNDLMSSRKPSRFLTEFYPVRLKLPPNCTGQRGANKNVVAAGAGHFIEYFEGVT